MINFRYHIVSIVAVFLALGIGVALGGTFLNRYTEDVLDQSISSAENRISATEDQNKRLIGLINDANQRNDALLEDGGTELLRGALSTVPVLLVTAPGVDAQVIADVRLAIDQADADLRGTLELRPELLFTDGVNKDVAAAVERDPKAPGAVRAAVFGQLRSALRRAAAPPGGTSGPETNTTTEPGDSSTPPLPPPPGDGLTTTNSSSGTTTVPGGGAPGETSSESQPEGSQPAIVTALLAADHLRYVPGPGFSVEDPILTTTGYRYIFVSGPDLDAGAERLLLQLLSGDETSDPLPAVVVSTSVPDDGKERVPTLVADVRSSKDLAARYSTVDNVETFTGLLATVLVLERPTPAAPGHYGQGDEATAILPPLS